MIRSSLLSLLLFAGWAGSVHPEPQANDSKVDFTRDIRPILANNCILCHGPDAKNRKGDLRLDLQEGAFADLGEGKRAIVPGKPDKSELFRRVSSTDREEVMPPAKTGKKLAKPQIDLLRRWIEQGAAYAKHWAFVKPERPALPPIRDAKWIRNEIDRFVLARLEKEGLKPSPETDRYALLRRASLDLTGLPPTIEEADAFANDADPAAYEKRVDRLLASPAFGERWARVWLDLARYADSQGYAEDRPRVIWPYRDWVIRALNANLPYDQFTIEQLAGDLLPNATEAQIYATAFHRNTLTNTEGGTDDEEFRNVAVVDRVNTTLQVWMGLTMNCAQCHDHKFDPFSQEEYFRIFAFLNSTEDADRGDDSPLFQIFTDEQRKQKKDLQDGIAQLEADLQKNTPELDKARAEWEAGFSKPIAWKPLRLMETPAEDGFAAAAASPTTFRVASDLPSLAAIRVEAQDFGLTKITASGIVAGAKTPNARIVRFELPGAQRILHIAELQVFSGGQNVAPKGKAKQSSVAYEGPAKLAHDGNTNGDYFGAKSTTHTNTEDNPWWEVDLGKTMPIDKVVVWNRTDGGEGIMVRTKGYKILLLDEARKPVETRSVDSYPNPSADWPLDGARDIELRAVAADPKSPERFYVAPKPFAIAAGTELRIRLEHKAAGKARLSATDDARGAAYLEVPADVRTILRKPAAERTTDEKTKLVTHHRSIAPELTPAREKLAALKKQLQDLKPAATLPILRELAQRRKTQIHVRGNFLVKGKEVAEGVPAVFPPLPEGEAKNRLGFARWLVHPDNPLTARVAVNRHWEQIFGTGLVTTSEDFGIRGEMPSHPELLDWLAAEFVAQKWDVKKLIKLLVTSAAYRQSSQVRPEQIAKDPSNRLLARGPRNRLDAETVRDQALFVSGLLSRKMLGPSVYPHQPKTGLAAAFSSSTDWEASKGEDKFRRGLYTFWRRSVPYPSMATFDAPDRNVCTIRRVPTNTPLQALVTMNDPVYVECSQALARKIMTEGGAGARDRASYGLRRSLARPPRLTELDRVVALFEEARSRYATDAKKAAAMATEPLGPAPQGLDVTELAAWTVVGNVLLNLDEMFMKR